MKTFIPPCLRADIEKHFIYVEDETELKYPGGGMWICKTCGAPASCVEHVDAGLDIAIPVKIICRSGRHDGGKAPKWRMSDIMSSELLKDKDKSKMH